MSTTTASATIAAGPAGNATAAGNVTTDDSARALSDLDAVGEVQGSAAASAQGPVQRIQLAIRATPEEIWSALTDGTITPAYYVGFAASFELTPGAAYRYTAGGGDVIAGTVLEVEPGRRLKTTFNGYWDADVAALPQSTVTFTLSEPRMPMPGVTLLSCVHEDLPDTPIAAGLETGWVSILSGLKTLLETGAPMVRPVD